MSGEPTLDIDRMSDWIVVEEAALRGDRAALAEWVLKRGAAEEHERELVARALLGQIDARKMPAPETAAMLNDLDYALRERAWFNTRFIPYMRDWIQRLRNRLRHRPGWTPQRIDAELRRRNYLPLHQRSFDEVFEAVAKWHGMEPEAVKQAHHRRRQGQKAQSSRYPLR